MKIRKVRYAKEIPGIIERHCAAFLTQFGQVIIISSTLRTNDGGVWPFFNSKDALRLAQDIMEGKKKSTRVGPIIGVVAWETTKYDEQLVNMAKAGQLVNAAVIENIPDSVQELQLFAAQVLRESNE